LALRTAAGVTPRITATSAGSLAVHRHPPKSCPRLGLELTADHVQGAEVKVAQVGPRVGRYYLGGDLLDLNVGVRAALGFGGLLPPTEVVDDLVIGDDPQPTAEGVAPPVAAEPSQVGSDRLKDVLANVVQILVPDTAATRPAVYERAVKVQQPPACFVVSVADAVQECRGSRFVLGRHRSRLVFGPICCHGRPLSSVKWRPGDLPQARRRALEPDETAIRRWQSEVFPQIARDAQRRGAHQVFMDESGFMPTPTVRRTWAPRGQTPVLDAWDRRDRISAISSISVSPKNRQLTLHFDLPPENVNVHGDDVVDYLRHLKAHLGGPLTVLWDGSRVHDRSKAVQAYLAEHPEIVTERLPAYAPELNPDELVWAWTKYGRLPNLAAANTD
jgi:hypothetical protein